MKNGQRIGSLCLALILSASLLSGCSSGIPQAEYDNVVSQKDAAISELDNTKKKYDEIQAELDATKEE